MCGICGIVNFTNPAPKEQRQSIVAAMNQAMLHRGPDEGGTHSDTFLTIGMRRLSIIDLEGGSQPLHSADGNLIVIQNGEIYNYRELRADLEQRGHSFQTQSDTEVLLVMYREYGTDMLSKLRGMFAFCLYDRVAQQVFVARDRFGEKPLFYHSHNGRLSFASELNALLQDPAIDRRLNYSALPYYLRTSLVPEPNTFLFDVQSLSPGHFLTFSRQGLRIQPYFTLDYAEARQFSSEDEAVAYIRPLLEQAVRRQTVSDVPLGAFLSGGIDSSTVVALLQQQSTQQIKTFTVRFEEAAFDESPIARQVAEYCGTDHHEITIPNYDFEPDIFWMIIQQVGQPFRDSSAIPSYFITREIRKHVKVALSGDGGDELFGGYALFQWYQQILQLRKIPRPVRQLGSGFLDGLTLLPGLNTASTLRKVRRVLKTSNLEAKDVPLALNEFYSGSVVDEVLGSQHHYQDLKTYPSQTAPSSLREIMHYRTAHTLPTNMLVKVDRMSMANSLEVRAPFLDPDLFAAAAQLPDDLLIRGGKGKYLLRKMMRKDLPASVFDHPKQGFAIPLYKYQNEAFAALANDLLLDNNPWEGFFPRPFLERALNLGLKHRRNTARLSVFQSAHRLWMLMQLLGWARFYKVKL
ncbi:MAG: asparagine synthase (glutamine-hydrolyzing) [Bacteroidota bacterium]